MFGDMPFGNKYIVKTAAAAAVFICLLRRTLCRGGALRPLRPRVSFPAAEKTRKRRLETKVSNSLVADGCVIEGEVSNCILFRGVKVEKGAKLSNCIIMQDSVVRSGANLKYVITDKNVEITEGRELVGAPTHYMTVRKKSRV